MAKTNILKQTPSPGILVVDQTIREGMQHRGLMLSYDQRVKIIDFQESLGVDVSQAAYPPAHESERDMLGRLSEYVHQRGYNIKIAGMGRALPKDIDQITGAGDVDIHLAALLDKDITSGHVAEEGIESINTAIHYARSRNSHASIGLGLLDIGHIDQKYMDICADMVAHNAHVDILTLPDTSGVLPPHVYAEKIAAMVSRIKGTHTRIAVHCHNDMGMAAANTIMGVVSGATAIEVSALGIGERNGIGDLFLVACMLIRQGYELNVKTAEIETFQAYYDFMDSLCLAQTGSSLLHANTPFFGENVKTHVAGTHGRTPYGAVHGDVIYLNVLCGKHLVRKYLDHRHIPYTDGQLPDIVSAIKAKSLELNRSVSFEEVAAIASHLR